MEKKALVDYDDEEDILSIIKADVSHSARVGDVILDFDSDSRIVGVEIMNALEFFEAFELSREDFKSINEARLAVHYSLDWAIIKITMLLETRAVPIVKDFTIPSLKEQEHLVAVRV